MQLGNGCTKHTCKPSSLWNIWIFTPTTVHVAQLILFHPSDLGVRSFRILSMSIFPDQWLIINLLHMPHECTGTPSVSDRSFDTHNVNFCSVMSAGWCHHNVCYYTTLPQMKDTTVHLCTQGQMNSGTRGCRGNKITESLLHFFAWQLIICSMVKSTELHTLVHLAN